MKTKTETIRANGNGSETFGIPPWIAKMREAARNCIAEGDIEEIVRNQVKRAKEGDAAAIRFVFDQVLNAGTKGATFVQNNFPTLTDDPRRPCKARPGTGSKIDAMSARESLGLPLHTNEDGPEISLD